jgi:hypothetical protein
MHMKSPPVLWTSGGAGDNPVGWLNTKMFEETGDAAKSQGWTSLIVDTNGNGKRDDYTEPGQPFDPNKDMRIGQTIYAVMPGPEGSGARCAGPPARWCGSIPAPTRRRPRSPKSTRS